MLEAARVRPAGRRVDLTVARLADPCPPAPLTWWFPPAVHHLDGPAQADLFERVAAALRPGGRFVLADVVVPDDPADAVTPFSESHDRPSTAADQLASMAAAGLAAGLVWAERDAAVVRADRAAPSP